MSWADCTLGDLMTLKRGHDLPSSKRIDGNIPVVSSSGTTGYHNEAKAVSPGVVTGRYGTLGEVFYLEQDYWPLNTALYAIDFKNTKPRFSAYFLKNTLRSYRSDKAAVPGVDRNVLHALKVRAPDKNTQERIVEVLSTYDDLMENNKRRIELLEESARQLYKEWFVRFRFPGHEYVKIIDGMPEGWENGSVGDIAKVFSGYAFKSKDWLDEGNPVIKIKNITSNNTVDVSECQCVDDNVAKKAARFKLLAGDMLIAMTGATVGKVGLVPSSEKDHYLNQRVGKFVSKIDRDVTPLLLSFFNSEKVQASILNLAGGAAQPNISAKQIESIEMPIPPDTLLDVYLDETERMLELRLNLVDQIFKQTQARDLLLPKLMNVEITV